MPFDYNTSANRTRNKSYNYSPNQAPQSIAGGSKSYNYSEIYDSKKTESSASSTKNKNSKPSSVGVWGITMGQTQNFTLAIKEVNHADKSFMLKDKGLFLPLKSLDYRPVKLDHLKIKAGVFTDLPFLHRRSMGVIQCVMHDSHKSLLSQKVQAWYNSCVLTDGYVPYISEMVRIAEYTEYTHDGKIAVRYAFAVMPENDFRTNRSYEGDTGALTEYNFSLIIVSNIGVRTGDGEWREADWGWGDGPSAQYERRVYGDVYDDKGQKMFKYVDPAIADQYKF